jgi:hypothetical protein
VKSKPKNARLVAAVERGEGRFVAAHQPLEHLFIGERWLDHPPHSVFLFTDAEVPGK